MKKIYCIGLDNDCGEIWLDADMNFLDYVHTNDATWRSEYHGFIIEYFGGELVEICPTLSVEDYDKISNIGSGSGEDYWNVIKTKVLKQLKKA